MFQCLTKESVPLTAFCWDSQNYAYLRSPMGVSLPSMAFQALISKVLRPYLNKFATCYLDDVCIFSPTFESHLEHIDLVLKAFAKANLKFNPEKCKFASKNCTFLGFNMSEHGIKPSECHTEAIRTYPVPKTVKQVRTFVGLVQFFKDFIPQRPKLTAPLTALCKKGAKFVWDDTCQKSFDKLKEILTTTPVLKYPNFDSNLR